MAVTYRIIYVRQDGTLLSLILMTPVQWKEIIVKFSFFILWMIKSLMNLLAFPAHVLVSCFAETEISTEKSKAQIGSQKQISQDSLQLFLILAGKKKEIHLSVKC